MDTWATVGPALICLAPYTKTATRNGSQFREKTQISCFGLVPPCAIERQFVNLAASYANVVKLPVTEPGQHFRFSARTLPGSQRREERCNCTADAAADGIDGQRAGGECK